MPGPLSTYIPPQVLVRTEYEQTNGGNIVTGVRIPAFVGVGQEELDQIDVEMVRGSSSTLDIPIARENVSTRFVVDGTNPSAPVLGAPNGLVAKFRVRNVPITDGQGFGRATTSPQSVTATVDGQLVAVGAVNGLLGEVTLQIPPAEGTDVRISYTFLREDTAFSDTVSDQVSTVAAILTAPTAESYVFVAGVNDSLIIKVDNVDQTMAIPAGTYTAAALKVQIDSLLVTGLSTSVFVSNLGLNHLRFTAAQGLQIMGGTANGVLGFSANTRTNRTASFRVFQRPIVDGTNGGVTTTDTSKVVVKVNSVQVIPSSVDGTNGIVTLPYAPAVGSVVTIDYKANTWQDTSDPLPNTSVTSVSRCGFAPNRSDYIQAADFVIQNPSADSSVVHWGASYSVAAGTVTSGGTPLDDSQVLPTLVDNKWYMAACGRYTDTTVIPSFVSSREFVLPAVPTLGNGRDTPLGTSVYNAAANSRMAQISNRPDLVEVRAGRNINDAMSRPAIKVLTVDATTRRMTLKSDVPPDHTVFATFWYSLLGDDTFIITNKVPGASGVGSYEVLSTVTNEKLYQVRFGTKSGLADTVQWPRGVESIPDAFHTGDGAPVSETATVTFGPGTARNAIFTTSGAAPFSFYNAGRSDSWRTTVNGVATTTTLSTATKGFLVSSRVALSGGTITVPAATTLVLRIDGTDVTTAVTAGSRTPAQIVTDINSAIDVNPAFSGTAPNTLASQVTVAGDAVFVIQSFSTPAALPGGFDHASVIQVRPGTGETLLGFTTFQAASGTPSATVKPGTILGTGVGPFLITAGVNDVFTGRLNGVDFSVTLTAGSRTAAQIVTDINAAVASLSSVGTLANLNKIRLTNTSDSPAALLEVLAGTANVTLGFTSGETASATGVEAQEVVNRLMATGAFTPEGVAYVSTLNGAQHVTIESLTTGAATSSIAFVAGAANAFNELAGTGIVVGTSGDVGEDASNIFTVTSSNPLGSAGTGTPGQTYTDARTGLRFTVLPAADGTYTTSGNFTLIVSQNFIANASVPWLSVGGLEVIVTDTTGVVVGDSATLTSISSGGIEPVVGGTYYMTYKYVKADFSTRLSQQLKSIRQNFGEANPENRLSLAGTVAINNGAVLVALRQVLKVTDTNQASDLDFIDALIDLEIPLTGSVKPNLVLPLATTTSVFQALMQHVEQQSTQTMAQERMGFIGFAVGTSPENVQTIARSLASNRVVACYPDSAVIDILNTSGIAVETLIDSTTIAAALGGRVMSPAVDVATPYTHMQLVGIKRLNRLLDSVTANMTAMSGVTMFEDVGGGAIRVRQGLTTKMDSVLTRIPSVTQIVDFMHIGTRAVLDPFIGSKFLPSRISDVKTTNAEFLKKNKRGAIIAAYAGPFVGVSAEDVTTLDVESLYSPIFPLEYLNVVYNLRSRL